MNKNFELAKISAILTLAFSCLANGAHQRSAMLSVGAFGFMDGRERLAKGAFTMANSHLLCTFFFGLLVLLGLGATIYFSYKGYLNKNK